jgi:hypothetical protein
VPYAISCPEPLSAEENETLSLKSFETFAQPVDAEGARSDFKKVMPDLRFARRTL